MYFNAPTISAATAIPCAEPKDVLRWNEAALPQAVKEAEARGLAVAEAATTLYEKGETCESEWQGEILAVAKKHPDKPNLPLAYALGSAGMTEVFLQTRDAERLSRLCEEIEQVSALYPANEAVAAWHAAVRVQHMRCLSRVEALDAVRLGVRIEELRERHPDSPLLAECCGKALMLTISLHSHGMDDEANEAPSAGNVRNLDKAAEEYDRLAALVKAFPENMELVGMQAEAALQLCGAFSSYGQPTEALRWLYETRKLYECFPDWENTAFSFVYSLGKMIASLKTAGRERDAEHFLGEAEKIVSGSFRNNLRLLKEYQADLQDMMDFYTRTGMTEKVEACMPVIEKWSEGHDAWERLRCGLNCLRMRLFAHLDVHDMEAAEKDFAAMRACGGTAFRALWEPFMNEAGQRLIQEYCRAGEFDEAERTLHEVTTLSASVDRDGVRAMRDAIRTTRQALRSIGLPELGNTKFTEWFANYLSSGDSAAGKKVFADRNQAMALMTEINQATQLLLDIGVDIKALEYYRIVRTVAGMLPDDAELADKWMEAGIRLLDFHMSGPHPRRAELLARELLDGSVRFLGNKRLRTARLIARLALHRVHAAASELELAEKALRGLADEYYEHGEQDDTHGAEAFADVLCLQALLCRESGQVNAAVGHAMELWRVYDAHPDDAVGKSLTETALSLGGYFLSHGMEVELAVLLDTAKKRCDGRRDDARLLALWSGLSDKMAMLRAANGEHADDGGARCSA